MLQKDPADFLNRRGVALAAMSAAHDELRFDTREMRACQLTIDISRAAISEIIVFEDPIVNHIWLLK
jgi:hypothetical protein